MVYFEIEGFGYHIFSKASEVRKGTSAVVRITEISDNGI